MGQLQLRDLLADVAEGVRPIEADVVDGALGTARQRRALRWIAAPAALVVVALAGALIGVPELHQDAVQPAGPGVGAPTIPRQAEQYSFLTAWAPDSPGGRAIAVVTSYVRDEARTVVIGADRNSYREIVPDPRIGARFGAVRLSPDGATAALQRSAGVVDLLNLNTGSVRHVRLPDTSGESRVFGFSPDGKTLAAGTTTASSDRAAPFLVDIATGKASLLAQGPVQEVAFSPDGARAAIWDGKQVHVLDRDGHPLGAIRTGDHEELAGPNAWSPDGRFLVTIRDPGPPGQRVSVNAPEPDPDKATTLRFYPVDHTTRVADVPPPLHIVDAEALLGWRSADRMVLAERTAHESATAVTIRAVRGGGGRVVLATASGDVESTAAGLLPTLTSRSGDDPDFGPWPAWLRWSIVIAAVLLALVIVLLALVARWALRINRRPFPA